MQTRFLRVAIIGASGYTGAELMRMLARHPHAQLSALVAHSKAGQPVSALYPHLGMLNLPDLVTLDSVDWEEIDCVFCCLPHGTTQEIIAALPEHLTVIDLSADFRLRDPYLYEEWYGGPHKAVELQQKAVYGLSEVFRHAIRDARLIACPGCYPTATQLPLIPLLQAKAIESSHIIVDAKSGMTGAGRAAKEAMLFSEVNEGVHAYGIGSHRHGPEIEQGLSEAAGRDVMVSFTPHLMPMNRGILATSYVTLAGDHHVDDLRRILTEYYRYEPFVHVMPEGVSPATRHVRGSNHCMINVFADRVPGRAILVSAIDNLVKGASGQAIQNFNIHYGMPEQTGLAQLPLFP